MYNKQEWIKDSVGFKQGEVITVKVDFRRVTVEWIVGDQVRRKVKNEKLANKNIKWVPYLFIKHKTRVNIES